MTDIADVTVDEVGLVDRLVVEIPRTGGTTVATRAVGEARSVSTRA